MLKSESFSSKERAEIYATMTNGFWEGPYLDDRGKISYLVWCKEENWKPVGGKTVSEK